jgi:hypothetical protein
MAEEVELYLMEQAVGFMQKRIQESGVVHFSEVEDFLVELIKKNTLPLPGGQDPFDVIQRAFDSASTILGLEDASEDDAPDTPTPASAPAQVPAAPIAKDIEADDSEFPSAAKILEDDRKRDEGARKHRIEAAAEQAVERRRQQRELGLKEWEAHRNMELELEAADPELLKAVRSNRLSLAEAHAQIAGDITVIPEVTPEGLYSTISFSDGGKGDSPIPSSAVRSRPPAPTFIDKSLLEEKTATSQESIPRERTQQELDERRRLLLRQREELLQKYPPQGTEPRKVGAAGQ